jgi:hypothetical protein
MIENVCTTPPKPKGDTTMIVKTIEFPRSQYAWDGDLMAIVFSATVNGRRIRCVVSKEALEDNFEARGAGHEAAFVNNRQRIIDVAKRKINAGDFLENGDILLSTFDF